MPKGGARPGAGRPKGSIAQHTRQAKEAIEQVFEHLQQNDATSLQTWASQNLDTFYTQLFPKLIPVQMQHSGENGGKLVVNIVRQGD